MRYSWIKKERKSYPFTLWCRVLQVSTSGYYDWVGRAPSPQQQRRNAIGQAVARSHFESYQIYGYRKVWEDLAEQEIACCEETVRRALQDLGLFSRIKRQFVVTTDSNHPYPIAENILAKDFSATAPNQKWLLALTYLLTRDCVF